MQLRRRFIRKYQLRVQCLGVLIVLVISPA